MFEGIMKYRYDRSSVKLMTGRAGRKLEDRGLFAHDYRILEDTFRGYMGDSRGCSDVTVGTNKLPERSVYVPAPPDPRTQWPAQLLRPRSWAHPRPQPGTCMQPSPRWMDRELIKIDLYIVRLLVIYGTPTNVLKGQTS